MDRRLFFSRLAAGIAGAAAAGAGFNHVSSRHTDLRTAVFAIKGFSCVTCATGLEVTLMRHAGVATAIANYPDAKLTIHFDEKLMSRTALKEIIASCGFTAREV